MTIIIWNAHMRAIKEIPNIMDLLSEFWQGAWFVQYHYSCIIEYRSRPLKWLNSL